MGVYRIPREESDNMTTLIMKELLPEGGTEEELESIDVLNGITDVYPPVFCMTSVADHQKQNSLKKSHSASLHRAASIVFTSQWNT